VPGRQQKVVLLCVQMQHTALSIKKLVTRMRVPIRLILTYRLVQTKVLLFHFVTFGQIFVVLSLERQKQLYYTKPVNKI